MYFRTSSSITFKVAFQLQILAGTMTAKKHRLMPDLDELECKRKQTKSVMKEVEAEVKQLKEINRMSTMSNSLSEEYSLLWLISLYELQLVFTVKTLTENQMLHFLSRYC